MHAQVYVQPLEKAEVCRVCNNTRKQTWAVRTAGKARQAHLHCDYSDLEDDGQEVQGIHIKAGSQGCRQ